MVLQDLGTYRIGIFTLTILASAVGESSKHVRSLSDAIADDIIAARGAALITALLIVGIAFAVMLADLSGCSSPRCRLTSLAADRSS